MQGLGADPPVIVTGAAGFIGFHVSRALLERGMPVVGVDSLTPYYDPALKAARLRVLRDHEGFAFERLDLADQPAVLDLFALVRPRIVVHLAAQAGVRHSLRAPQDYVSANVAGMLSVLEAARAHPVEHLLYASSSSVYGANGKVPFSEEDRVDGPVSLYAATKRAGELMAATYAHLFGIPASGLRFFTVYGPWGRPDMAYWLFTEAIRAGRPIDLFNHGAMERDFTYVDDVVAAILRLIAVPPAASGLLAPGASPHVLYNVGNHTPVTLARFVTAIEAQLGRKALTRLLPMQPGDVPRTYADVTRLQRVAGFSPDTTIEEGIARFVRWFETWQSPAPALQFEGNPG